MSALIKCVRSPLHGRHVDAVVVTPQVVPSLHGCQNQVEGMNVNRSFIEDRSFVRSISR